MKQLRVHGNKHEGKFQSNHSSFASNQVKYLGELDEPKKNEYWREDDESTMALSQEVDTGMTKHIFMHA
jgi:hypothetical protein